MIHVAGFSGGKDSTALLIWLRRQGIGFTAVFNDTGWEHPLTYGYVDYIEEQLLGGKLVRLKPDQWLPKNTTEKYVDMRDLVTRKGRVPSIRARFCTEYLKINPMQAWIAAQDEPVTFYQGIRAEESPSRAAMGYEGWSDYYDCQVVRPLFTWTAEQVFALLAEESIPPNPLYLKGSKRVGCFPCVLTRHAELKRLSDTMPEVWDRIAELERLAGRSYFPPGFIPARFCSHRDEAGATWPSIADVQKYLDTCHQQLDLYGETPACTSVYNLCE